MPRRAQKMKTIFALATSGDGDGEGICAVDMSLANAPGASEGSILAGQATACEASVLNELGLKDALPEMTAPVVAVSTTVLATDRHVPPEASTQVHL